MIEWFVKGKELGNCNCSYGCPCQFNALPSYGNCQAAMCYQIDEGRFGDVRLDGLRAGALYQWPAAVHMGNGTMQLIIDERANEKQRDAIERIMRGEETKDMGTMWWVYNKMCPNKLRTLICRIDLEIDVEARRGRFFIPGVVETVAEPIRNPVTGLEHRARIDLPNGFEYQIAEIASGTTRALGEFRVEHEKSYGQFAYLHLDNNGVVRDAPRAASTSGSKVPA